MGKDLASFVLSVLAVVALVSGVEWLIWKLWCWVLPQLWAGGPENIIRPGFWLFFGAMCLLGILTNGLRSKGNK